MFMPHFFSVEYSLKTLLHPWKNIITVKKKPGFSLQEVVERAMDNLISRFMGFIARGGIVGAYLFIQVLFVIFLPLVYIGLFVFMPLQYLIYRSQPTEEEKKKRIFEDFMKKHLGDQSDTAAVGQWFELYYQQTHTKPWWTLEMLMKQPPLGRDLTAGYTPRLDRYVHELTREKPHYKNLIGRKKEIDLLQQVLSKSVGGNAIISGEPGTGRRTIVEALAKVIYEGRSNPVLAYRRVLELDMEKILSEQTDSIKREQFLSELLNEAAAAKNIVLCIPNIERYLEFSSVIEKYAQLPTLQFIGITTPYHYQKFIQSNKVIAGLFEKVDIAEISEQDTLAILLDVAIELEKRHRMFITYEAVNQSVVQAGTYITDKPFPEKAIFLLDEACVYVNQHEKNKIVTSHVVNKVIETITHIPTELSEGFKQKLLNVEAQLHRRIVSQDEAVSQVGAALRKSFVLVGSHKKPIATFLFLGPTGVGKTETAKAITEVLFADEHAMLRFDMSQYQSITDIPLLIGSSATNEPGLLTQAIRQQKYGTLLLDELEKAHKDLLNIFLTILDEGYFTDGSGNRVDCTHLIIIATSNAGADFIYQSLTAAGPSLQNLSQKLIDLLVEHKIFTPEFLNRFDGVVVYKPLEHDAIYSIAKRLLDNLKIDTLKAHGITIEFSTGFIDKLIKEGYDARFGARNMQRIIRNEVEDKIAQTLLSAPNLTGRTLVF